MNRILHWIVDRSRFCGSLAILLAGILSTGLPRLEIDASTQSLFPADEPDVAYYQNVRANFGSDSSITIVAKSPDPFQADTLRLIRSLATDLESMDGIRSVLSFFSVRVPKRQAELLKLEPLIDSIPDAPGELEKIKQAASADPIIQQLLLNNDGTAVAIHVLIRSETGVPGFEEMVVERIRSLVEKANGESDPEVSFYAIGAPLIKKFAARYIWHDLLVLGPIALLVIGAVVFFFYRSLVATLLPLTTGVLSVLATLGAMGWAGFVVNPFASVIVVLILVMGCTEDLHILSEYRHGLERGLKKRDAVAALGPTVGNALFLTSLTTLLGFITIAPNPIIGLREFAIACAAGIFLNFVITILLVPSLLQLLPVPRPQKHPARFRGSMAPVLSSIIRHHPLKLAGLATIAAIIAALGVSRLTIDTSYLRFFPKDSEIGTAHAAYTRDFGGASAFMVTVETGKKRGVYEVETFREIAKFHDHLADRFDHVTGFVDFLRRVYLMFTEKEPDSRAIPETQQQIDMFSSGFGSSFLSPFIDYDGSRTAIRIRSLIPGSKGMRQVEREILEYAGKNLSPHLEVRVTGERVLTARFSDQVTRQLIQNLLVLAGVVTLLLTLFFRSVKFGLLAVIPNTIPVLITFGYMGWAGIPLSTGTFAVAIVAFGIAVDDTIHFMTRFFHESKFGGSANEVIANTLSKELQPVMTTSIALTLGYLVLLFSPFLIHRETGILFAIAITSAFLADLFVTPVLLRYWGGLPATTNPTGRPPVQG